MAVWIYSTWKCIHLSSMLRATTFTELHSMKTFQHVNNVNTKEQNRIVVYCHCNNLQGPTKKGKSKDFVQK